MRRFLIIFALLVCPAARATITVAQNGSATATSATLTSTQLGDLIIVCGNRASTTEPTVATGYATIKHSTGANTQSATCGYKLSKGGETSTGTWTNATNVAYIVLRGYDINSSGPLGCNPAQDTGSSTTLTFPTCTLTRSNGTSMVLTFGTATGATTTPPDTCASGFTLASSTSQSTLGLCYDNGYSSSSFSGSITIAPTTGWVGLTFEILGQQSNVASASSNLIQTVHTSQFNDTGCNVGPTCGPAFTIPLPNATLSNNFLQLDFDVRYTSTAPTVSSIQCNGGTSWTWTDSGHDELNTTDLVDSFEYYIAGATAGCTTITVTMSAEWYSAEATFNEWKGIATSSPVDTGTGVINSGTSPIFGTSITPGTSGDLITLHCAMVPLPGGGPNYSTTTPAPVVPSGGFTSIDPDIGYPYETIAAIYNATTSVSAYEDFYAGTASNDGNCIMMAYKTSSGAGTSYSGVHIVAESFQGASGQATVYAQMHMFNSGDTLATVLFSGETATNDQFSAISDSLGSSFTKEGQHDDNGTYPEWGIDCDAGAGDDLIEWTGGSTNGWNIAIVEISGLNNSSHTACIDVTGKISLNNGTGTGPYTYTGPSLTATNSGDLQLSMFDIGTGPTTTSISSPSGAEFLYASYGNWTDQSIVYEGGGFGGLYSTGTSAQAFVWGSAESETAFISAVDFLPAASSSVKRHRSQVIQSR